jgi:hypothetical protein
MTNTRFPFTPLSGYLSLINRRAIVGCGPVRDAGVGQYRSVHPVLRVAPPLLNAGGLAVEHIDNRFAYVRSTVERVAQAVADRSMVCALFFLVIACADTAGPAGSDVLEPDVRWVAIAAGGANFSSSTCGLSDASVAYCWGSDIGESARRPMRIRGDLQFTTISVGYRHACGVASEDAVYCFGDLFDPPFTPLLWLPRLYAQGLRELTSASYNSCGLDADGTAVCWDGHARFGVSKLPAAIPGGVRFGSLAAGGHYGEPVWCGIALDGATWCWGSNHFGALGTGSANSGGASAPVRIAGDPGFAQIAAGYIVCGRTAAGAVYCWGPEVNYPPFQENVAGGGSPVRLTTTVAFRTISVGQWHACGLDATGAAWCWGNNLSGQLGTATSESGSNTPLRVAGGLTFTSISAGTAHTCALTPDHHAYCWGLNDKGQLGDGSQQSANPLAQFSRTPIRVQAPQRRN